MVDQGHLISLPQIPICKYFNFSGSIKSGHKTMQKKNGASWELNPGPLTVLSVVTTVAQSENHTTRPRARSEVKQ